MPVAGVICEFDPFHLGHASLLRRVRARLGADTGIVCLMSGNYVQRGYPALYTKFVRARAAVDCGADLVLELPLTRAAASAEGFADGGAGALDRLGVVDCLCFGSESGDLAALQTVAAALLRPEYDALLRRFLDGGKSYAACRQAAARALAGAAAELLSDPNDNLAVEYCKALLRRKSSIQPLAFQRPPHLPGGLPDPANPSATMLRGWMLHGGDWTAFVPPEAAALYRAAPRHALEFGERAVLARLRALPDEAFDALPYGAEGLSNRFRRACRERDSLDGILSAVKSKRYALARLRRMALCAYLGLTRSDLAREPPYVRVLAFNDAGRALLRAAKKAGRLPLVNAGETPPDAGYYALERRASDLYTLFSEGGAPCRAEEDGRVYYRKGSTN